MYCTVLHGESEDCARLLRWEVGGRGIDWLSLLFYAKTFYSSVVIMILEVGIISMCDSPGLDSQQAQKVIRYRYLHC